MGKIFASIYDENFQFSVLALINIFGLEIVVNFMSIIGNMQIKV